MSENQEEFDALRKAAYSFVNEHGKEAVALRAVCEDFMGRWRDARGSAATSAKNDRALIDDVVRWTMNRYNRPRYKPKRSREERAKMFLLTPAAYQISGEDFGRASIRNTARITGQSVSTVARHLSRQGIAPRREAKIRKLSKTGQELTRILDETFDRRAYGIIQMDRLGAALWDGAEARQVPATTRTSRRKRLKTMLAEISAANLSYSIVVVDDICGIHRGRRFPSLSEAATWIAEEKRLDRYAPIRYPSPQTETTTEYFWADPVVIDAMAVIDMAVTGRFHPSNKLDAIFRFERILFDITPVLPWLERAYHSYAGDDMAENLSDLASMITDPDTRKAVRRLGTIMRELKGFTGSFPLCFDAFQTVDFVLGIMDKTAEASPESFAKLAYIRDWFEESGAYYDDVQNELAQMLEKEKSGEWQAPDPETLSRYLPVHSTNKTTTTS
ncbi:hypothetical protein J2T09_002454 [Neorhizobium huautlense]|uniref:Uncharacterized protein n=1 Tax=Neorhizobium huautlense TaxID=67774 RepID=A0ABT9PTC2_9HYPH|nr:hypothetical protein [Neorhizobium huautlense]MDP9837697.1 hypothetical protein [Neorhizobium huautlense]